MPSVIVLNVVTLSVVMLSVVAPILPPECLEMNVNYDGNDIRNAEAITSDAIK